MEVSKNLCTFVAVNNKTIYKMNEKVNIAELLRYCPMGMELDCTMYDNVTLFRVSTESDYPIKIVTKNGFSTRLTKYGQNVAIEDAKCVIFPKGKTTWEGFVQPSDFKDGDIVYYNETIAIFKEWGDETLFRTYVATFLYCDSFIEVKVPLFGKSVRKEIRLATEDEKEKLFKAIKDNGYTWNEETKTLERLVEPKFKDGDILSYQCEVLNNRTIYIYRYHKTMNTSYYVALSGDIESTFRINDKKEWTLSGYNDTVRLATEGEKEKLFQAIKDNGYTWNEETKTLDRLVEPKFKAGDRIERFGCRYAITEVRDNYYLTKQGVNIRIDNQDVFELVTKNFDIATLKPFDKVLVRDGNNTYWTAANFSHYKEEEYPYFASASCFKQCIPYEGNEHLLGKTDDCDEYYKTW